MRITIQAPISQHQVNERSSFTATAKFYADTAAPWTLAAPTTVQYRIDCLETRYPVRDWTSVTAASSVSIAVASADNAIIDNAHQREKRMLTVMADSGLSTQSQATYEWNVINLPGQY